MTPRDRAVAALVELVEDSTRRHTKRLAEEIVDQLLEVRDQEIFERIEECEKRIKYLAIVSSTIIGDKNWLMYRGEE